MLDLAIDLSFGSSSGSGKGTTKEQAFATTQRQIAEEQERINELLVNPDSILARLLADKELDAEFLLED